MRKVLMLLGIVSVLLAGSTAVAQDEVVKINFQSDNEGSRDIPEGYLPDYGYIFGDRGNGWSYGWSKDATDDDRDRDEEARPEVPDQRYDTLCHIDRGGDNQTWEIALPNGYYDLFVVCGDAENNDQTNNLQIENVLVEDPTPYDGVKTNESSFDEYTLAAVKVEDGRLSISKGEGGTNPKICFIDIYQTSPTYNPVPVVEAGDNLRGHTGEPFELNGSVTDEPALEGDPGTLTFSWSQQSGAGTLTFSATDVLNPTVVADANGLYEIMLQASDGTTDVNDVVIVNIRDREYEKLVGYWDMEGDFADKSDNSNDGVPTADVSLIDEAAIGQYSALFPPEGTGDPNHIYLGSAPELDFVREFTVSAWVKTTSTEQTNVFSKGGDGGGGVRYILSVGETDGPRGRAELIVDNDVTKVVTMSTTLVNDGFWHFIVGACDGWHTYVYVDGRLEGIGDVPANYDLSGSSQKGAFIGVGIDAAAASDEDVNAKGFVGQIDDVRVYDYPVALADLPEYESILNLTAMGPVVPQVVLDPVDSPVQYKFGDEILLHATVTDLGAPSEHTILWTTLTGPDGAEANFTDPSNPQTGVSFPAFGTYTLRLTVIDQAAEAVVDTDVTITLVSPTCEDVFAVEGGSFPLAADLNKDCHINLEDFALMASDWMRCYDPADITCEWPF